MLITIQYPFADMRPFVEADGGRLAFPRWMAPDPEADFVRSFGAVTVRPRGGASIGGEQHHCEAQWAVRFEPPGLGSDRRCAFRRFYADGNVLAKFELGIARDAARGPVIATEQLDAAHELLVRVPRVSDAEPAVWPLGELGPALARAYRRASTSHRHPGPTEPWWVRPGAPMTLVVHRVEDAVQLPGDVTPVRIAPDRSLTIAHAWHRFRGKPRRVWFLGYQPADHALARQLRIDLVRLHSEREALQIVLRHIARGALVPPPRSERSDRLQRYLSDAISAMTRLRSAKRSPTCEQSCRLVTAATSELLADDTALLVADLELQLARLDARPNIRRKVRAYAADVAASVAPPAEPPRPSTGRGTGRARRRNAIAFLAANPMGTSRLQLDDECAAIERELSMTAARDEFELCSRWAVTVDELMRHLAALAPTVIHISGHGPGRVVDPGASERGGVRDVADDAGGAIYLEDEVRHPLRVDGRALAQLIGSVAPSARVVVLNACFSDALADPLCDAVECVVGMRGAVEDRAARSFAAAFYRALGNRGSVATAMRQAAASLAAKHPASEQLPTCRTRTGVTADDIVLARARSTGAPASRTVMLLP